MKKRKVISEDGGKTIPNVPKEKEHLDQNKINLNNELMKRWGFTKKVGNK